jgi:hypothetical protein
VCSLISAPSIATTANAHYFEDNQAAYFSGSVCVAPQPKIFNSAAAGTNKSAAGIISDGGGCNRSNVTVRTACP